MIVGVAVASIRRLDPDGCESLARPKSSTLTVPSGRTLMLAGFKSRWMTPASWADSSASTICRAIVSVSSTGIGPRAIRSASVGPSTNSMANACTPPPCSSP
ncbi:MAG: hypothetical protein A3I61_02800 [Acidobacteria bacterium RIFCSPLOWO2_02_FULL_68_18]|nr:MAG: hypothetical protein A3I61_02800 [Acidobacteria bacterium RIFCSPLOWO2_02_FULL_68_18]OFW48524.1 MAG: hypothetical protein A3G77_13685 [Acidobacteria bacterium RIFCSPLOWO2_12_FULL_68_19]